MNEAPSLPAAALAVPAGALRWDIFCRVIDNFGDIGVCWRLARQLAAAGDTVRLVVDDASPLAWMAPRREETAPRVSVWPWAAPPADCGDVVIEAFGCDPPQRTVDAMLARRPAAPVWINLEYLSAEAYVERSHGLPSPRADGLRKWFFYPGFTPATGGLLREPGLLQRRAAFDGDAWLAARGLARNSGERVVSLFCYDPAPAVDALLATLASEPAPTRLLLAPGPAQGLVRADGWPPRLRIARLPWLAQDEFDHLLWSADLNAVRGEDSLVRALWAGAPFLWHVYPQADGAHAAKLRALLAHMALPAGAEEALLAWNGLAAWPGLPALEPWQAATRAFRDGLLQQEDLASQLRRFVGRFVTARRC
ncbi:MAG: elongation factor P maturation arginine rhamnosyltransferase EarP [Rubrivivax sp.]|nr:elongation factor P maturation arginine rhamnosyltransferase EarP [Rubrivivax sp.]